MKNSRRSLYLPFTLGHFANDLGPCSVVVLAPSIALEMGLNPMEVGLLLTLHTLGSALGFFPAGLLADSARNRGNLLMLTFWWVGLGYLLASWALDGRKEKKKKKKKRKRTNKNKKNNSQL